MCDGGRFSVVVMGVFHNFGSGKADGGIADDAAYFACGVADEADSGTPSPKATDCTPRKGDFCTGAAVAGSG